LLGAPAWTVKQVHNHSNAGHIGPVALDHKSSKAADRMLRRIVGAATGADRPPMKTKGGNSLQAATSILPMS